MQSDELSERLSQDNRGAQDAQDGRMEEIAEWLRRGYKASEAECDGYELPASPHGITLPEHMLPKNVLRDADGDIYVIDAEFMELPQR